MRWVRQDPWTEDACGQCCAAMLLGIPKREAVRRVGHALGTTTREMAKVLRDGGLRVAPRLQRVKSSLAIPTERALLLGTWRRYAHWMVWTEGRLIDPVEGPFFVAKKPVPSWIRVTHYLAVE